MGWLPACGLVQHMHRRMCLIPGSPSVPLPPFPELRGDRPLPPFLSKSVWYVYIDNFHADELSSLHSRLSASDLSPLVKAWREAAHHTGALFSPEKALSRVPSGLNLGLWANGDLGAASLPAESLAELVSLTLLVFHFQLFFETLPNFVGLVDAVRHLASGAHVLISRSVA